MNEKAVSLGMTSSSFTGPIGTDNRSTAADLLRLLVHAESHEEIREVWGEETWTVSVEGAKSRRQTVKSTVIKPALEEYYHILGGKTGTLSQYNARNLAVILEIPDSGDKLAVVALYADGLDTDADNRFEAARLWQERGKGLYNNVLNPSGPVFGPALVLLETLQYHGRSCMIVKKYPAGGIQYEKIFKNAVYNAACFVCSGGKRGCSRAGELCADDHTAGLPDRFK